MIELTGRESRGFLSLVWSDYEVYLLTRSESLWFSRLLWPVRLLINPSLQLAWLVRVAQCGPRIVQHVVRLLQVWLFSSEIYWFNRPGGIEIGPAISFPHPVGILLGPGLKIGAGVSIYHFTVMGGDRSFNAGDATDRSPTLGDRSVVFNGVLALGDFSVGHDAVVGARVILEQDVPPGALLSRHRLRAAGEWPGEQRPQWRG